MMSTKISILPEAVPVLPATLREFYQKNGYLYLVGGVISDDPQARTMFTTLSPAAIFPYIEPSVIRRRNTR